MSRGYIDKPASVTLCDYCEEEISDEDMSQWAHIVRGFISRPTKEARYLKFLWIKSKKYVRYAPGNEVEYDFHAACFDKLMNDLREQRQKLSTLTGVKDSE